MILDLLIIPYLSFFPVITALFLIMFKPLFDQLKKITELTINEFLLAIFISACLFTFLFMRVGNTKNLESENKSIITQIHCVDSMHNKFLKNYQIKSY